jgi:hypothetical protein
MLGWMKLEIAMRNRLATSVFSALLMVSGIAAPALADGTEQAANELTGYWQQGDGEIFHFIQEGTSLTSRGPVRSNENDLDFSATIHGNLIYGAHRGPFFSAMRKKCALQIWVGMGLTLNDDRTILSGFRGDRIVDPKSCSVSYGDPVKLVYTRVPPNTDSVP